MNEDNLYLLFCYIIYGLTLAILTFRSRSKARTIFINAIILCAYSALFIYNLNVNSEGGSGLVWLVGLMCSIGLHWLINLTGVVLSLFKATRPEK